MSEYEYLRDGLSNEYGILDLQNKILEIMVYIDKFCNEHNIVYYLMGGSALGAMRHGGFIPWDDDLDIFMDYENYHKFLDACKTDLDTEKYYLQCEDSKELPYFFSKIRMNGTACIEQINVGRKRKNVHQGIFVDVMCLNKAANGKFGRRVQYYAAGLLKAKAVSKTYYKSDSFKKKLQLFIAKITVWGPFKRILLHLVRKYNKKDAAYCAHLFGRAKFKNSFYPIEDFGTPRYVPFEKVKLAVPSKVEDYLVIRYGKNYMQLPDEKTKALYQSHAMQWSVDTDYKDLLAARSNDNTME